MTTNRPPSCDQLPTKPGPYYWRESDGDEFQLVTVELHIYNQNPDVVHLSCYSGKEMRMLPIKDLQGQWLPIPPAEELVEMRAKAKAYDEGEYLLSCIGADLNISLVNISESNYMQQKGYTCSKVRVCKEVDERLTANDWPQQKEKHNGRRKNA